MARLTFLLALLAAMPAATAGAADEPIAALEKLGAKVRPKWKCCS